VRRAPVDARGARAMLASLKGKSLLAGFRGQAAVDVEALVDIICRLSELANDLRDEIDQIDVNPVIVGIGGAIAVDALVVPTEHASDRAAEPS